MLHCFMRKMSLVHVLGLALALGSTAARADPKLSYVSCERVVGAGAVGSSALFDYNLGGQWSQGVNVNQAPNQDPGSGHASQDSTFSDDHCSAVCSAGASNTAEGTTSTTTEYVANVSFQGTLNIYGYILGSGLADHLAAAHNHVEVSSGSTVIYSGDFDYVFGGPTGLSPNANQSIPINFVAGQHYTIVVQCGGSSTSGYSAQAQLQISLAVP